MHLSMLECLRCPFCGTRVAIVDSSPLVQDGDHIEAGVLGCECCAYPIVAGIPVLIADDRTRTAMHQLEAGRAGDALLTLLGLEGERARAFGCQLASPATMTYRTAIEVLSPDPEGTYFIYHFSDPTFVMMESMLRAIAPHPAVCAGRVLDVCGGSGHLARVLGDLAPVGETVLVDLYFWKLWLAKTITSPTCEPVCCNANSPLPFARDSFRLVVLADAFPYIFHKRMLADEMIRVAGDSGTIFMPHLHSSLGENFSPGMTLTPASYQALFAPLLPRLYSDAALLDDVLGPHTVDLGASVSAEALGDQPSFTLLASRDASLFSRYSVPEPGPIRGELRANPLYRVELRDEGTSLLTLTFPYEEYAEEFGECKRYLPESVTIPGDARGPLDPRALGPDVDKLRRSRILIDAPHRYC